MQKKMEAELMSLAHSILKLKNRDDIEVLKQKAHQVYEKLSVLAFIEGYVKETPHNKKTVEELVDETFKDKKGENRAPVVKELQAQETEVEEVFEVESDIAIESKPCSTEVEEEVVTTSLQSSLEKEFEDTISLDVATDIFDKAERIVPKKSINDVFMQQKNLQIDLNDRIALVKNLFNNSQEEFNRVISQLNTISSEKEALSLLKMVKKEYNWNGQEVYEERLLMLIERKFN